jgi:hypothetical protein
MKISSGFAATATAAVALDLFAMRCLTGAFALQMQADSTQEVGHEGICCECGDTCNRIELRSF